MIELHRGKRSDGLCHSHVQNRKLGKSHLSNLPEQTSLLFDQPIFDISGLYDSGLDRDRETVP